MTLYYQHSSDAAQRDAAERVDEWLREATQTQVRAEAAM